jgi:hypothetical protein
MDLPRRRLPRRPMEQTGERHGGRVAEAEGRRTEVSSCRARASLAEPTGLIGSALEVNAERVKSIVAQYSEHVLKEIEIRGN